MDETVPEKLDLLRMDVMALTKAIEALDHRVHLQGEMIGKLISLLVPEEKPGGPTLAMEMAKLAHAVANQNRVLESLAGALTQFMRDMPGAVVRAVMEATDGLGRAIRDLPGKVLTAVKDARP